MVRCFAPAEVDGVVAILLAQSAQLFDVLAGQVFCFALLTAFLFLFSAHHYLSIIFIVVVIIVIIIIVVAIFAAFYPFVLHFGTSLHENRGGDVVTEEEDEQQEGEEDEEGGDFASTVH